MGKQSKKTSNKGFGEVLETTGHLMQLHKLQGALLAKMRKQVEHIGKKTKN